MSSKRSPTTKTTPVSPPADQRDPFPATIPDAFGFNSHYWDFAQGGNQGPLENWSLEKWEAPWGQLDPMADMGRCGFPLHRSTVAWNVNEPSPGTYNWKLQDALMRENARCGLRPLLFLAYGHPRYDASSGPSETCKVYSVLTPEGIAGYAAWAGEVARRYRGRQVIYEIWNEPNIHIFWPKPDPDAYMAMLEATVPAIRAADPTALIAGGALSNVWGGKWDELDLPYLTRCLERGLLEHVDILSFHPYNLYPPERIRDRQIIPIRDLITHYAPAGKRIELLITEVGYGLKAGSEEGELGFGLTNAAFEKAYFNELGNFLPRTLLSNLSLGVPTVWYELNSLIEKPRCPAPTLPESQPVTIDKACDKARDKDCLQPSTLSPSQHSQNPSQPSLDNPDHPGLFFHPNRATWGYTPGVAAVRVLSNTLRGYAFHQRLEIGDPQDDFVFELRNGERRALALWTAAEDERKIVLPLPAGAGTLVTYEGVGSESGVKTPVQWPAKQLKLTLNNWPKYLLITEE